LFPLLTAGLLLVVRSDKGRAAVVVGSAVIIMAATLLLAAGYLVDNSWKGSLDPTSATAATSTISTLIPYLIIAIDAIIALYILTKSIRHKKPLAAALAVAQLALILGFEFTVGHNVTVANSLYIDPLSVIMALIIGIIGGGICIYALGYMKDFQAHLNNENGDANAAHSAQNSPNPPAAAAPAAPAEPTPTTPGATPATPGRPQDRRPIFFSLMFLFLSAMFTIVFANNLTWLLCAWEVTTVCSFALIGYTRTKEAINNSFRQIIMNLLGGIAFAIALFYLGAQGIGELDVLIKQGAMGMMALPIALIAFAGMTKAAQVPFQSWLLGAMVAPTPTSALLHSSTMVKAGVFILIKLAPTLGWNGNGIMVVFIGGLTFLFCSAIAITRSNAKQVLAYSTIANLGLIVTCAGVGTPEAIWAAIFLLIFHAAAKSLLFLCVGTAEHHIGSRDIEDMDNLFVRMPGLARLMALGILAMFVAPFGMLISKWATIVSLVEANNLTLLLILAFGSAVTFVFWSKWLGKLLSVAQKDNNRETRVHRSEWSALALMAILVVGMSVGFPFVSEYVVVPYLFRFAYIPKPPLDLSSDVIFGIALPNVEAISFDNLLIMAIIVLAMIVSFLVFFLRVGRGAKRNAQDGAPAKKIRRKVPVYLSGVGMDFENRTYRNSLSKESTASQRNWYMEGWFGSERLTPIANVMCITILVFGLVLALMSLGGWSL
jgi:ech hydrogenase subunit A